MVPGKYSVLLCAFFG